MAQSNSIGNSVLVRLGVQLFRRTMTDKKATRQTHKTNSAADDAGRYVKALFAPAALKPFEAVINAARAVIAKETVPWDGNGSYILVVNRYQEFNKQMGALQTQFDAVREDFLNHYNQHIAESKQRLGKLFREEDFPNPDDLREDCQFRYGFYPVPQIDDIRTQDPEISAAMVDAISTALTDFVHTLAEEAYDEVRDAHEQLRDGERFRIERIERLQNTVARIRDYNLTNDPRIAQAMVEIEQNVIGSLNDYIDTRNKRNVSKDDKDAVKDETLQRVEAAALRVAGLFNV